MNNRNPFPGAFPRANRFADPETDTIDVPKAVLEARLRSIGGNAALDAIPNAPPRFDPHKRKAVGHAAAAVVRRAGPRMAPLLGRPKREKCFGLDRPVPLDREAKCRLVTLARALKHPTEPGKHYGKITAKALDVVVALLWTFHNAKKGFCFPSYEAIAKAAHCCRDTVAEAIRMLEAAGILTWCNRITRVWVNGVRKVVRTSNSYRFVDPDSKSEIPSGTLDQVKKANSFFHKEVESDGASRAEASPEGQGRGYPIK
jgi:Helix-turn-helix domain